MDRTPPLTPSIYTGDSITPGGGGLPFLLQSTLFSSVAVRGGFQLRLNSSIEVVTLFAKALSSFEEPSVAFLGGFHLRFNSSIELVRALCEISSSFFIKCEEKVAGCSGELVTDIC